MVRGVDNAPSHPPRRPLGLLLWGTVLLGVTALMLIAAVVLVRRSQASRQALPVLFTVPDFHLTNQLDQVVTRSNLLGSVWVVDIIFTRCAGPCPLMSQRMSELQSRLPRRQPVRLISLTTDAAYDTPTVLRAYAKKYNAEPEVWSFLTGDPRAIANFAIDGLKLVAAEKPAAERTDPSDLFVHSTYFVVVDQRGRARAVFNYDDPEMKPRLLRTVDLLLREPPAR